MSFYFGDNMYPTRIVDQEILDQYTDVQWIAALIMPFLTFPIGAVIPAYFYLKASNGDGRAQGQWKAWGVILMDVIGIAAVELAGETGGKIAVALLHRLYSSGLYPCSQHR
jgi:hypothetical protein